MAQALVRPASAPNPCPHGPDWNSKLGIRTQRSSLTRSLPSTPANADPGLDLRVLQPAQQRRGQPDAPGRPHAPARVLRLRPHPRRVRPRDANADASPRTPQPDLVRRRDGGPRAGGHRGHRRRRHDRAVGRRHRRARAHAPVTAHQRSRRHGHHPRG